ncbi:MAG: putative protease, partial [Myxococcaceae bacterium]|nr:putative protease [Myxococcaceae bacterium]
PPLDLAGLGAFFGPDFAGGFVDYYQTASLGRYQPHVTLAQKVFFDSCPLPAATFPTCEVARGDVNSLVAGLDMMREIIKRAKAQGTDFSKLDVNGKKGVADGYADGVMVLLNVPFGGVAFPISFFNRDDNLNGGTGGAFVVDGVKIPHIAIAGYSNHWVMIHEFGHLLGLTDLYDESNQYDGLHLSWMGAWSYDSAIPLPDAETRWRLRWANWHQVSGRQRVIIKPVETSGEVWRLGTGDEYFLIENRGPGGRFDRGVSTRGLAVFHVDRGIKTLKGEEGRFVDRLLSCVNCDPWHPYIMWVQADGLFDLQLNGKPNSANDLFRDGDELKPAGGGLPLSAANRQLSSNFYSGLTSGYAISGIRVFADDSIEVTFEAPSEGQCGETLCAEGEGCAPVTCADPGPSTRSGCGTVPGWLAALALGGLLRRRRAATSS